MAKVSQIASALLFRAERGIVVKMSLFTCSHSETSLLRCCVHATGCSWYSPSVLPLLAELWLQCKTTRDGLRICQHHPMSDRHYVL